jgi:hypothetical protein
MKHTTANGFCTQMQNRMTSAPVTVLVVQIGQPSICLLQDVGFRWKPATIAPVREIAYVATIVGWLSRNGGIDPAAYQAIYYVAALWVLLFLALQSWAIISFARNEIAVIWPLKMLRSIAGFSASVAFIPLLVMLISVYPCRIEGQPAGVWVRAGYDCFSSGHLVLTVISTVLAISLTVLCTIFTLVFGDVHPLSGNLTARAHGRVEFIMLLMRVLLVIVVRVCGKLLGPWPLIGVILGVGAVWISAQWFLMP